MCQQAHNLSQFLSQLRNLLVMERTFVILIRFFPLPEDFLTVKETVKDYVPVDTESVIHKL